MQQVISAICIYTAGAISTLFGLLYLFKPSFLHYHREALQKGWSEIDPAFRVLILALMRAVGGGAVAVGFSIIILQYYFMKTKLDWIAPVIFCNGLVISVCGGYAMLLVRLKTPGRPPLVILVVCFLLVITGYYLR